MNLKQKLISVIVAYILSFGTIIVLDQETVILTDANEQLDENNYRVGLWGQPWSVNGDFCIREYLGNVFSVKNFEETSVIYNVSHPSSDADWNVIRKEISVDYNNPKGIYCQGISPRKFQVIYPSAVNQNKYTLEMKCGFSGRWSEIGVCFNFKDKDNYSQFGLIYDRDEYKLIRYKKIEGGNLVDEQTHPYQTKGDTAYMLKVKVNHEDGICDVYIDGILEWTLNIPASSRPSVYVDDDFNETTPGWNYDHFNTIQEGIDVAEENEVVYVFSGTYYENIVVNKAIKLIGEHKNTTIIDGSSGSGNVVLIQNQDHVTLSNFTIRNAPIGNYPYRTGHGIHILALGSGHLTACHNTITSCIVHNNSDHGIYLAAIDVGKNTDYNIISNCEIFNNGFSGISIISDQDPGGWSYCNHNTIMNCTIYNNCLRGDPENHYQEYPCGILLDPEGEASNNTVTGCTIYNHKGHGIYSRNRGLSCDNYFYHNYFLNVTDNVYDEGDNYWDDGYPNGGNYYLDFDEPSEGAWDNNSDGIVDNPYNIPGGSNQDRYPLLDYFVGATLDIQPRTFPVGQPICLNVIVNSCSIPVKAVNVKINYTSFPSSTYLTDFISYKLLGSSALEVGIPITPTNTGIIDYAQALPLGATPKADNGTLFTMCFDPVPVGSYQICFEGTVLDSNDEPFQVSYQCVNISVEQCCACSHGDYNCDCMIDFIDFVEFANRYNHPPIYTVCFDFDEDGDIDFYDFVDFTNTYGVCYCDDDYCCGPWCECT